MSNINKQLSLPSNGKPFLYQPSLYVSDGKWVDEMEVKNGWSAIVGQNNALEMFRKLNPSSWLTYPSCSGELKSMCVMCKAEAQAKPKNGWIRDGKKNYISCMEREIKKLPVESNGSSSDTSNNDTNTLKDNTNTPSNGGSKAILYVGIGVGVVALSIGAYFMFRKK